MWYNVIVKKHKNIIQIEISDPVYSFSEVMDHIDLKTMISCGFNILQRHFSVYKVLHDKFCGQHAAARRKRDY